MKRILLIAVFALVLFAPRYALAQATARDLAGKICDCLTNSTVKADSIKVIDCRKTIHAELAEMTVEHREKVIDQMKVLLNTTCKEYDRISTSNKNENKGDWQTLDKNPASILNESECKQLTQHKGMYYLQGNGDTTYVQIADGVWKETSGHGLYTSTNKFRWLNDCDFELEFVKSTNPIDKKYFKKGEKLINRLVDRTERYYNVTVSRNGIVMKYRLYHEDVDCCW